jgi:hypothetical protein
MQLEGRLATRIDAAEARMGNRLEAAEARMGNRLEAAEARMEERLEATETRLLTEFHKWASPMEARQRTHAAALRAMDLEMEALEDRVSKLEGKQPS